MKRLRFKNRNYYASLNSTEVQRQVNLDTLNPDPLLLRLGSVGSKDEWDLGSAPREETIYRDIKHNIPRPCIRPQCVGLQRSVVGSEEEKGIDSSRSFGKTFGRGNI